MIRLDDDSRWKLIKALSNILYQQGEPPLKPHTISDVSALKTLETSTSMYGKPSSRYNTSDYSVKKLWP